MSGFKHRGEDIRIDEGPTFKEDGYTVDGNGKVIYKSETRFSRSYADRPDKVLEDAKRSIDRALDKENAFYDKDADKPDHRHIWVEGGPSVHRNGEVMSKTGLSADGWTTSWVSRY